MKQAKKISGIRISEITVILLFCILIILTVITFFTISHNNAEVDASSFKLENTDEKKHDIDISRYLVPEFIGITVQGNGSKGAISYNITAELYRMMLPTIYTAIAESVPYEDTVWNEYTEVDNSVYVRYHGELADTVIAELAGMYLEKDRRELIHTANIYEMFIIPDGRGPNNTIVAVRGTSGSIYKYIVPSWNSKITAGELSRMSDSFKYNMLDFVFAENRYDSISYTEPMFTDSLKLKEIIMTDKTASMIRDYTEDTNELLRLFKFNPDKLLNTHTDDDNTVSYSDSQGILYLRSSEIYYARAYYDKGIPISDITGDYDTGLDGCIRASLILYEKISEISRDYTGGDAELILKSASCSNGITDLTFVFTVDNIVINDNDVSLTVRLEDGIISSFRLFTFTVRPIGSKAELSGEWWFIKEMQKKDLSHITDVMPVYRSDFLSECIQAEWSASVTGSAEKGN